MENMPWAGVAGKAFETCPVKSFARLAQQLGKAGDEVAIVPLSQKLTRIVPTLADSR